MKPGGISSQLKTDYFFKWINKWVTQHDLEEIVRKHGNRESQIMILDNIFIKADFEAATSDLYNDEKGDLIDKLEAKAVSDNPSLLHEHEKRSLGFAPEQPAPEKSKYIKQRSIKGNEYTRSKPQRWNVKEKIYLQRSLKNYHEGKLSMSNLQMGLKRINGKERSKGSVTTKIRRIEHEKKTD